MQPRSWPSTATAAVHRRFRVVAAQELQTLIILLVGSRCKRGLPLLTHAAGNTITGQGSSRICSRRPVYIAVLPLRFSHSSSIIWPDCSPHGKLPCPSGYDFLFATSAIPFTRLAAVNIVVLATGWPLTRVATAGCCVQHPGFFSVFD